MPPTSLLPPHLHPYPPTPHPHTRHGSTQSSIHQVIASLARFQALVEEVVDIDRVAASHGREVGLGVCASMCVCVSLSVGLCVCMLLCVCVCVSVCFLFCFETEEEHGHPSIRPGLPCAMCMKVSAGSPAAFYHAPHRCKSSPPSTPPS